MTAQGCVFTYQDRPRTRLERYPLARYPRQYFDLLHIKKWKVPAAKKHELLNKLNDVGINWQTLFPDLEGLGRGIPEIQSIRTSQVP
jgi:hypothetical protein